MVQPLATRVHSRVFTNLPIALAANDRATISTEITTQLAASTIETYSSFLPTTPDVSTCYISSPLGLVDKSDHSKRWIHPLSFPAGSSIKDFIDCEKFSLQYSTLDDAIRLLRRAGKGAVMIKRDLKDAFRHIPVSPVDLPFLLVGFSWEGIFYLERRLPLIWVTLIAKTL